ncbi:uncharacterized protein LOC126284269 [Schistocerca gregaria]|uniref:uncharacterized protein LOC126284269 n=1 Tax=Schistocerca gregaria TaxID=7010 RepID=UPI00211F19CD|nr:uncharacterized protein LOC126284269 [Schistocerca gregaria]
MKSSAVACSLLLLTMAAVSSGRNAGDYFQEQQFQYSPSRPEDALVFFIANIPPFICEPDKDHECASIGPLEAGFCLSLPRGYSPYKCSFEGNATTDSNLKLVEKSAPLLFDFNARHRVKFRAYRMCCTTDSPLPDEYFRVRIQRPHEDHPMKCLLQHDTGMLYLRFPGYPTIYCQVATEENSYQFDRRYHFNLPGIADDPLKCAFRVYSELPLAVTQTEERMCRSLISGLPTREDGTRLRVVCSRHDTSHGTAHFQLLLQSDVTYDCSFPDAASGYPSQPQNTPQG